jgi:hypothetical protein
MTLSYKAGKRVQEDPHHAATQGSRQAGAPSRHATAPWRWSTMPAWRSCGRGRAEAGVASRWPRGASSEFAPELARLTRTAWEVNDQVLAHTAGHIFATSRRFRDPRIAERDRAWGSPGYAPAAGSEDHWALGAGAVLGSGAGMIVRIGKGIRIPSLVPAVQALGGDLAGLQDHRVGAAFSHCSHRPSQPGWWHEWWPASPWSAVTRRR